MLLLKLGSGFSSSLFDVSMAGKWGVSLKKEDKVMDERRKAPACNRWCEQGAGDEETFLVLGM